MAADLGLAEHVKADAVGEPGQRTFRVRLLSPSGSACLWMEKEQLQALGMAIDQLVAQLRSNRTGRNEPPAPASESGDFPTTFDYEFRVTRLGLGYDDQQDVLVLLAHDPEADLDGPPTLTCRVTRGRMRTLSSEIGTVIAAGRPRCPLCNTPLTGGPHACPGSNGHTPHPISG
ncbi:MAG TPA: DUF3090 family protein [Chloroflexota bacterium]|nr:DUF3090 family protein [Chloroflexota bacterium]